MRYFFDNAELLDIMITVDGYAEFHEHPDTIGIEPDIWLPPAEYGGKDRTLDPQSRIYAAILASLRKHNWREIVDQWSGDAGERRAAAFERHHKGMLDSWED
jgi:hypothetical protein